MDDTRFLRAHSLSAEYLRVLDDLAEHITSSNLDAARLLHRASVEHLHILEAS